MVTQPGAGPARYDAMVATSRGRVGGLRSGPAAAFLGIPYATAARFSGSVSAPTGVRSATSICGPKPAARACTWA